MKRKLKKATAITTLLLAGSSFAQAESFWVTGTITRTLLDPLSFGGCMIQLSSELGHGCAGGWVSLDCKGGFSSSGEQQYSTALMAFSLNKTVSIKVDNTKLYNTNFCVSTRLDVIQ